MSSHNNKGKGDHQQSPKTPNKGNGKSNGGASGHATPQHNGGKSSGGASGHATPQHNGGKASPASTPKQGNTPRKIVFEEYWSEDKIKAALASNQALKGPIRVNQKNYEDCYVPTGKLFDGKDINIRGMDHRNRALDGDEVIVEIFPRSQWNFLDKDAEMAGFELTEQMMADLSITNKQRTTDKIPMKFLQPVGRVVSVTRRDENRLFVGSIKLMSDRTPPKDRHGNALFVPKDSRVPRMLVPFKECPDKFFEDPEDFGDELMVVRFKSWPVDSNMAFGTVVKSLGQAGDIDAETEGIVLEHNIDTSDWPQEALDCLPKIPEGGKWEIPEDELARRTDLRTGRIFSIDPPTARDLDDALSCEELADGTFQVGVHIADVTYFVKPGTKLDEIASQRATTTYLVQRVFPMLPRLLCENLCSLEENQDRLSFSVVWKIAKDGTILDEWVGRTVMRSCARLAYGHAQRVIENPDVEWTTSGSEPFPMVFGGVKPEQVKKDIVNLHNLAVTLRKKRFDNGALRLDKTKLAFRLDGGGIPVDCVPYIIKDSNKLVEEFMLLANMAVAKRIYDAFPKHAFLRSHPPPLAKKLEETIHLCRSMGIEFEGEGSLHLQRAINAYAKKAIPEHVEILQVLLSQPMQVAKYFCTGQDALTEKHFWHFALSVPFYTHFTSPIRRYADVVVHRLLDEAIKGEVPYTSTEELESQAAHCNARKAAAAKAQDASSHLFMCVYLGRSGPFELDATVLRVLDRSFDVFVQALGIEQRVPLEKQPVHFNYSAHKKSQTLRWETSFVEDPETGERSPKPVPIPDKEQFVQEITTLTKVRVRLSAVKNTKDVKIDVLTELVPPVVKSSTIPFN